MAIEIKSSNTNKLPSAVLMKISVTSQRNENYLVSLPGIQLGFGIFHEPLARQIANLLPFSIYPG